MDRETISQLCAGISNFHSTISFPILFPTTEKKVCAINAQGCKCVNGIENCGLNKVRKIKVIFNQPLSFVSQGHSGITFEIFLFLGTSETIHHVLLYYKFMLIHIWIIPRHLNLISLI